MRTELEQEKRVAADRKRNQREQARKILTENELHKIKMQKEKEIEQERENKMIAEYNAMLERQEKKRAEDMAAKEAKI